MSKEINIEKEKESLINKLVEFLSNPYILTSLVGFGMIRKEYEIIDSFLIEEWGQRKFNRKSKRRKYKKARKEYILKRAISLETILVKHMSEKELKRLKK